MQTYIHPFWTNPYDDLLDPSLRTEETFDDTDNEKCDTIKTYYVKFMKTIINQVIVTHQLACKMEANFKNAVFGLDTKSIPKTLKDYDYEWLPTEELLMTYLEMQQDKIEEILPKMYTQLQTVSVGLEMIFETENHNQFNRLKTYLRSVLCEIYTTIKDCQLMLPCDVPRSVVPKEVRSMTGNAETKIRNWIIFRNFIDILKCITDVLKMYLADITIAS